MQRRTAFWLLLGLLILGVSLRSWELTQRSIWFDEAFSWRLIQFPWGEILSRTAADVHPPLYYLFLKTWSLVFSDSALALRSFSVSLSAAAILLIYGFTASAFTRRTGLLAASFIALSAWQIPYASEVRMYMLGTVLAVLSTWLLFKAMRKSSLPLWIGYILSLAAFLYTHNFALLTFLAHGIWLAGIIISRTKGRFGEIISEKTTWFSVGSIIAVVLLYLPWLPVLLRQTRQVQGNFWIPELTRWSIPDTLYHFFLPTNLALAHSGPALALTLLPGCLTILLMIILLVPRPQREAGWLTVLCFVLPFLGTAVVSLLSQSVYQERYLIFAQGWIFVALAAVIAQLPFPKARAAAPIVVWILLGTAIIIHWRELDLPKHPGMQAAMKRLQQSRKNNDPIFVTSPFIFLPARFYDGKEMIAPDGAKLVNDSEELSLFAGKPVVLPEEIVRPSDMVSAANSSIWTIDTTGFSGKETSALAGWRRRERLTFSEVYPYQGDIIVSHWLRPHLE